MPSYFDTLEQFSDYLVIVTNLKEQTSLMGLYEGEEFSYSLGASLGESSASIGTGLASGAGSSIAKKVGGDLGSAAFGLAKGQATTIASTLRGYDAGNPTPFSVSFHIFRGHGQGNNPKDYKGIVDRYSRWTQPRLGTGGIMQSHLYSAEDMEDILTKGTDKFKNALISVQIGSWFEASGLFCEGLTPTYSTIVDSEGQPIYLKLSATFVPYKVLTPGEVSAWHK